MLSNSISTTLLGLVHKAMGCLFSCLRGRDRRRNRPRPSPPFSDSTSSTAEEPVSSVSENCLSSLLLYYAGERNYSPSKDEQYCLLGSSPDIDINDLKDQAKFLKACGTLPQTPAEIREAGKIENSTSDGTDLESSEFHSWLPNSPLQKLNFVQQPEPTSPINLSEEQQNEAHSPNSCLTVQDTGRIFGTEGCDDCNFTMVNTDGNHSSLVTPLTFASSVQRGNRSVHFDCQSNDTSSSSSSSCDVAKQNFQDPGSAGCHSVSKHSPYPTPLKLTDDMQTPGTVFPSYQRNREGGKNLRIRCQYVYPNLNPIDNCFQLKSLIEEDSDTDQQSDQLNEQLEQADKGTPTSEPTKELSSFGNELNVERSLSSWLKLKPEKGGSQDSASNSSTQCDIANALGDKPIIGMVAAHWNGEEDSCTSPKWFNGNGIPNSNSKYKEDQKVSWHATPFEERLEKALSEDASALDRNYLAATPILFVDAMECDSPIPHSQPSRPLNSVVSF